MILILILFLFYPNYLFAKNYYLLINAAPETESHYDRHFDSVKYVYEKLIKQGEDPTVIGSHSSYIDGKGELYWKYTLLKKDSNLVQNASFPPIHYNLKENEIEKAIQTIGLKMLPEDTLIVDVIGHGTSPTDSKNPSTAGIFVEEAQGDNNSILQWEKIGNFFEKYIPKKASIKLTTTTCFGGGAHSLSRKLENLCSASTVPYTIVSKTSKNGVHEFRTKYWESIFPPKTHLDLSEDRETFGNAALKGLSVDRLNHNLGNISSFDYIDYTIREGVYSINPIVSKKSTTVETFNSELIQLLEELEDTTSGAWSQQHFNKINFYESCYQSNEQKLNLKLIQEVLTEINKQTTTSFLEKILANINDQNRFEFISKIFKKKIKLNKQPLTQINYLIKEQREILVKMQKKVIDIINTKEANKLSKIEKSLHTQLNKKTKIQGSSTEYLLGTITLMAIDDLLKELDKKTTNIFNNNDIYNYMNDYQTLERLRKLSKFKEISTPEQKEKLSQLLKCELEKI